MKKFLIFLMCLALLAGGGWFGLRQYQKNQDESVVVDVVPVSMMAEPAEYFMYGGGDMDGQVNAANVQKIYVDTEKLVQKVLVHRGESVKKGDVILEYDMTVVELELAQKENQVRLIEQNIKMANKELAEYHTYKPSEDMPQPDPEPDPIPEPDPEPEPEPEPEPVVTVSELNGAFQPAAGTGMPDDPFIFNCNTETQVLKSFMITVAGGGYCAELHVYDAAGLRFLYKWVLDGTKLSPLESEDWPVTDGLIVDPETGSVSVTGGGKMYGILSFEAPPQDDPEDFPDDFPDESDFYMPDDTPSYTPAFELDPNSKDYMYSRREIQQMIAAKQTEIKQLEISLKSAKLAFENAQKQKSDGKVIAEMDGIVKKIGTATGEAEEEEDDSYEMTGMPWKSEPMMEEEIDDPAFAIIEGDGGAEVICTVSELNLPKVQPGTRLEVMSYMNGAHSFAEVISVDDTPISYTAQNWGDNPQNSSYQVHARLEDAGDFVIGNWVRVTLADSSSDPGSDISKNVFMPAHYVRQEGGDYYIMKQGEDGRLVKQYVRVGRNMYGYYLEITGGLNMKDKICFPYGKNVKEGVRTNETDQVLYPSSYY